MTGQATGFHLISIGESGPNQKGGRSFEAISARLADPSTLAPDLFFSVALSTEGNCITALCASQLTIESPEKHCSTQFDRQKQSRDRCRTDNNIRSEGASDGSHYTLISFKSGPSINAVVVLSTSGP